MWLLPSHLTRVGINSSHFWNRLPSHLTTNTIHFRKQKKNVFVGPCSIPFFCKHNFMSYSTTLPNSTWNFNFRPRGAVFLKAHAVFARRRRESFETPLSHFGATKGSEIQTPVSGQWSVEVQKMVERTTHHEPPSNPWKNTGFGHLKTQVIYHRNLETCRFLGPMAHAHHLEKCCFCSTRRMTFCIVHLMKHERGIHLHGLEYVTHLPILEIRQS